MRLRQRLLAARKGAEDQESQLGSTDRLRVDEANSFWQQRSFRRRIPLELAHHSLVAARWEDPDRLLLNPHFFRLMQPAVAFLRGSEGFPPAFRAAVFRRRLQLGYRFGELVKTRPMANLWWFRTHYWRHQRRQMLLRRQLRLRRAFRRALERLRFLVKRVAAAASRGALGTLQQSLGLGPYPVAAAGRRSMVDQLAREHHFQALWRQLRAHCGPSLPANGSR